LLLILNKTVKIYGTLLSANARKVQAVALELGVKAISVEVNVYDGAGQSEQYLQLNPLGKID